MISEPPCGKMKESPLELLLSEESDVKYSLPKRNPLNRRRSSGCCCRLGRSAWKRKKKSKENRKMKATGVEVLLLVVGTDRARTKGCAEIISSTDDQDEQDPMITVVPVVPRLFRGGLTSCSTRSRGSWQFSLI